MDPVVIRRRHKTIKKILNWSIHFGQMTSIVQTKFSAFYIIYWNKRHGYSDRTFRRRVRSANSLGRDSFLPFFCHFATISATIGSANPRESLWETLHQQKAQITRDRFMFHPRSRFPLTLYDPFCLLYFFCEGPLILPGTLCSLVSLITITFLITARWQFPASSTLQRCAFAALSAVRTFFYRPKNFYKIHIKLPSRSET